MNDTIHDWKRKLSIPSGSIPATVLELFRRPTLLAGPNTACLTVGWTIRNKAGYIPTSRGRLAFGESSIRAMDDHVLNCMSSEAIP